jgi:hypothetical protein
LLTKKDIELKEVCEELREKEGSLRRALAAVSANEIRKDGAPKVREPRLGKAKVAAEEHLAALVELGIMNHKAAFEALIEARRGRREE